MDKLPQHETYSDSELSLDGIGSDIESISTYTSHSRYDSRDYWLGKSYFNYLVAKSVTAAQSAACSMEDLDMIFQERLLVFSYEDGLESVAPGRLDGSQLMESPYIRFLRSVGRACRLGSEKDLAAIASAVERCFERTDAQRIQQSLKPIHPAPTRKQDNSDNSSLYEEGEAAKLFTYSMILKEHCDRQGELLSYKEEWVRGYPPKFKVTAHFQGLSFEGTASSKKTARHYASREACKTMQIAQ